MICPMCGGETNVVDSRSEIDYVYRRRRCQSCCHRFITIEIDQDLYEKLIKKRDNK